MDLTTKTIQKIIILPNHLLDEVNDFIDFLIKKHDIDHFQIEDCLVEQDMGEYLENLNNYEDMLQQGKIQW